MITKITNKLVAVVGCAVERNEHPRHIGWAIALILTEVIEK
jgi:hypothetical protein